MKISRIYDQHVHSHYSHDSEEKPENYIQKAIELGIDHLVFTNHFDLDYPVKGNNWTVDFDAEDKELNELSKKYPNITLLRGVELGYEAPRLNDLRNELKNHYFDVINFSLHKYKELDFYYPNCFNKLGIDTVLNIFFEGQIEMLKNYDDFDVVSHVDYAFKTAYLLDPALSIKKYEKYLVEIFNLVIEKDKTLEINTKVQEGINNDAHLRYLLQLYKSLGGKYLTISSDAHRINRYCSSFDKYIPIIKEEGFDYLCYFIGRKRYLYEI